jgi:hypothetical protein
VVSPDSPITKAEVFYYLADISHRTGDDKKALQMLERSLDASKDYAPAKELLAKLPGFEGRDLIGEVSTREAYPWRGEEGGKAGDFIQVKNPASGKSMRGEVVDERTVKVN